jgi:exodeoxyribonuclease VII large subunit
LSPLASLERGYSICYHLPSGQVVTDARQVRTGDIVEVRLHQGEMRCWVEEAKSSRP